MRALTLLLALALGAPAAVAGDAPERGHLVLNGGGGKPREVMQTFVDLAGGPGGPIVVFPTASGEPDTGAYYRDLFRDEYGVEEVWVAEVAERPDAFDPEVVQRVEAAGGIWFAGGDQRRITAALLDTPAGDAVRSAYERGAVVGGTSAGTACQSALMITGDGDFEVITADNVVLAPGLGLFDGVIVDQHFIARQRLNRLLSVVLEHPEYLGVGVDEATAVWVRPDGTFRVLGDGQVVVVDASGASVGQRPRDGADPLLRAVGVRLHVLTPGDEFSVPGRCPVASVVRARPAAEVR